VQKKPWTQQFNILQSITKD